MWRLHEGDVLEVVVSAQRNKYQLRLNGQVMHGIQDFAILGGVNRPLNVRIDFLVLPNVPDKEDRDDGLPTQTG